MRLIDAKAMMREYQERLCLGIYCAECTMTDKADGTCLIERWIYAQPVIDAVEVVRCKECKHKQQCRKAVEHITYEPTSVTIECKSVDFCSYGKRRE